MSYVYLKFEHVLSKSVSDALLCFGGSEAEVTAIFVKKFDERFDAVNVCNFSDVPP